MKTMRCIGGKRQEGCGKWLIKYDDVTLAIIEKRRFVQVYEEKARPPDERGDDGRIVLDIPRPGDPSHPDEGDRLASLRARGVHVGPTPEPEADDDLPITGREIRCNCGARYTIPPSR